MGLRQAFEIMEAMSVLQFFSNSKTVGFLILWSKGESKGFKYWSSDLSFPNDTGGFHCLLMLTRNRLA